MQDHERALYLEEIERQKQISEQLTTAHRVAQILYASSHLPHVKRAAAQYEAINNFDKSRSRMKSQTIEKRIALIVAEMESMKADYEAYGQRQRNEDLAAVLKAETAAEPVAGLAAEPVSAAPVAEPAAEPVAGLAAKPVGAAPVAEPAAELIAEPVVPRKRGGARPGAGRKRLGEQRQVLLTMPQELWAHIDAEIGRNAYTGYSDMIRSLVNRDYQGGSTPTDRTGR